MSSVGWRPLNAFSRMAAFAASSSPSETLLVSFSFACALFDLLDTQDFHDIQRAWLLPALNGLWCPAPLSLSLILDEPHALRRVMTTTVAGE
jgi:hypothetical protein